MHHALQVQPAQGRPVLLGKSKHRLDRLPAVGSILRFPRESGLHQLTDVSLQRESPRLNLRSQIVWNGNGHLHTQRLPVVKNYCHRLNWSLDRSQHAKHHRQVHIAEMIELGAPHLIRSEEQLADYTHVLYDLTALETPTLAQIEAIELLTLLIERCEEAHYALPEASPAAVLSFLLAQHNLKQREIAAELGGECVVSEVLSGSSMNSPTSNPPKQETPTYRI